MSKSWAQYKAERRRAARTAGFCITCCARKAKVGRRVCKQCIELATERKRRRTVAARKNAVLENVIKAHEKAGDVAHSHRLYEDAAQHYQDALNVDIADASYQSRLSEKLAYALALGNNPHAANVLFDQALTFYDDKPEEAAKTIEILLERARQFWIDARRESAQPLLMKAVQIANTGTDTHLRKLTNSRMAGNYMTLGRFSEARPFLQAVGKVHESEDPSLRTLYYTQAGIYSAAFGRSARAFDCFERAVKAAKESPDVLRVTSVWVVYGFWAATLGATEVAKACYERSLLVARQYHIGWRVPHLCLTYATLLFWVGQYQLAYEYLINALAYDAHAPLLDNLFAEIGIPLALHMKDETMLARCAKRSAVDAAFRSGEPGQIGPVASSFAQWHWNSGRKREARLLLHRAVEALRERELEANVWELPLTIARFASDGDIPTARKLIESRAQLPNAKIALASLELFDALIAKRDHRYAAVQQHATNAAERFEDVGWYGYANIARELIPASAGATSLVEGDRAPFADMLSVLSARERQIAELVLKGYANREIAGILAIKERTVETHMTSIMGHIGVQSRHQFMARFIRDQASDA